jgi:hypothetical protein
VPVTALESFGVVDPVAWRAVETVQRLRNKCTKLIVIETTANQDFAAGSRQSFFQQPARAQGLVRSVIRLSPKRQFRLGALLGFPV